MLMQISSLLQVIVTLTNQAWYVWLHHTMKCSKFARQIRIRRACCPALRSSLSTKTYTKQEMVNGNAELSEYATIRGAQDTAVLIITQVCGASAPLPLHVLVIAPRAIRCIQKNRTNEAKKRYLVPRQEKQA
jgi:hypothetical protein